tara:strand:+ start:186922 stop:187035 length:114 start_codon:yes stop_codon:yes gene_type:complete
MQAAFFVLLGALVLGVLAPVRTEALVPLALEAAAVQP